MRVLILFKSFVIFLILSMGAYSAKESSKVAPIPDYYKKYTFSLGRADAPVKVEEVFSFLCPTCIIFHQHHFPVLKKEFIDTGKVQWTYIPYLMDMETLYVMKVLHACSDVLKNKLFEYLLSDAKNWKKDDNKDAVITAMKTAGIPDSTIQRSFSKKHQQAVLNDAYNFKEFRFVDGTPTFFINGEEVKNVPSAAKFSDLIKSKLAKETKCTE